MNYKKIRDDMICYEKTLYHLSKTYTLVNKNGPPYGFNNKPNQYRMKRFNRHQKENKM